MYGPYKPIDAGQKCPRLRLRRPRAPPALAGMRLLPGHHGTFYGYFKTQDELLATIVDNELSDTSDRS